MSTEASEKVLWVRFKEQGDSAARDELVIKYMRTVKYIAGRMALHVPSSVEMDDLIGWGVLGLMDALEKYDHTQDVKFSTYSSIRIRGAIIDEIRSLDWAPRSLRSMARKVRAAKEKLRHQDGQEPSVEAVAETLGTDVGQVEEVMSQLQAAQMLSLDDYLPSGEGGATRKIDITSDPAATMPGHRLEQEEKVTQLAEAILKLPDQQQKVLNLYYYEELTLKEIGAVLGVSESRVCQINSAAMKRLRKVMQEGD